MAVTPQTNTTLSQIAEALKNSDRLCLCGHVSPDGDCMGSQLALAGALAALGKAVTCVKPQSDPLDDALLSLPGAKDVKEASRFNRRCDVFVALDVPNRGRMGAAAEIHKRAPLTITVDHHAYPERVSDLSYTDPDAPATALLVWELVKLLGVEITPAIATCAYAGLMTDTGGFRHSNTTREAFEAAAQMMAHGANPSELAQAFFDNRSTASLRLEGVVVDRMRILADGAFVLSWVTQEDMERFGAVKSDCEPLIDAIRSMKGVRVACMLREQPKGEGIRGSFRAKDDTDVAAVAEEFNGGGHRAAAGFKLNGSIEEAVATIEARMLAMAEAEGVR